MRKENWKPIADFEAYEVSDLGRVRRRLPGQATRVGHILTLNTDKDGYHYVNIAKIGQKYRTKKIHRLVAEAFIPNPLNLPEVNHKGKKKDNRAHRLEWRSRQGHAQDQALREQQGTGVCFDKRSGKYKAKFSPAPRKIKWLGTFTTKKEALAARKSALKSMPYIL
jgi:hypothetical protein